MKKKLLYSIFFFACLYSTQAQTLYGLTNGGGDEGGGTLIKFIPSTNNLSVARSFENRTYGPQSGLIQASDGKLYGMTAYGGSIGYGVIYSYDPSSSTYKKLKNFGGTDGAYPSGSLVQAGNGKLYGTTTSGGSSGYGVIFSFDPSTSIYTKLIDFVGANGSSPTGSLIQASDGKLYGMTSYGGSSSYGVIFSFDPSSSIYTKLMDFGGSNGANPYGSLLQANDGKLYGMTFIGGKYMYYTKGHVGHGHGGYYRSDNSGNYRSDNDGYGVIFSFNPKTSAYKKLVDFDLTNGAGPYGSLMQASNGILFGTTYSGGSSYNGVIFSFDPNSTAFNKLIDFDGSNGANPTEGLMQASNGKLYGVTIGGGVWGYSGVIFSFDPNLSAYEKLVFLGNTNGTTPSGSLVQASNGKLYGTTSGGGSIGDGVIFSYDPSNSTYTKLMEFDGVNGNNRHYGFSLINASNGKLYGVTSSGGSNDYGVIFSFDPSTSTYIKLVDFIGSNGQQPSGSLMQASNGKLFGMTLSGGSSGGGGVIFSYDPSTSIYNYINLNDYGYINGAGPYGGLVQANDGKLYGTTAWGGSNNRGVIFSFDPSTSTYTKLKDFDYTDNQLTGSMMQASDGKLYGLMIGGGGSIFSFDPSTSTYTKLKFFGYNDIDGSTPYGSLLQASDGKLYGMTYGGGTNNLGVIFSFDPSTSAYTKLQDYNGTNGANPGYGSAFIELNGGITQTSISLSGKNNGNNNILAWKTKNETDLNNYVLQRSTDGKNFSIISHVKPTGNTNYSYDDPISTATNSIYYYRLKSINKDGKFSFSSVVKINYNKQDAIELTVAPNPVYNSTSVSFTIQQTQHASLKIFDANGKMIKVLVDKEFEKGKYKFQWNTAEVRSGIYFLHFVTDVFSETKKLLVIK